MTEQELYERLIDTQQRLIVELQIQNRELRAGPIVHHQEIIPQFADPRWREMWGRAVTCVAKNTDRD